MFVSLSRLSGLTTLQLAHVYIDSAPAMLDPANLPPFPTVRSFTFTQVKCAEESAVFDMLSDCFPNLEQLSLRFLPPVRPLLHEPLSQCGNITLITL